MLSAGRKDGLDIARADRIELHIRSQSMALITHLSSGALSAALITTSAYFSAVRHFDCDSVDVRPFGRPISIDLVVRHEIYSQNYLSASSLASGINSLKRDRVPQLRDRIARDSLCP